MDLRMSVWGVSGASVLVAASSLAALTFEEGPISCDLTLAAEPAIGTWASLVKQDHGYTARSNGGYRLALRREKADGHALWTLDVGRDNNAGFRITDYALVCRTDLGRVASVFDTRVPDRESIFRQSPQIDVAFDIRPNAGIPFMMACDHYGNNSMAVGPIDQAGTYRMSGQRTGATYTITIVRNEYDGDGWFTGTRFKDSLFVSAHEQFWFDAARAYADVVDQASGYAPRPIPAQAYRPYYSTWYAFGDDINALIIWDNAVIAQDMGIGNFLIFIGWSECEDWFSSDNKWGDYTPCESRFPDFAGLVRRMQDELGLTVQVWTAPTWVGASSESFASVKDYRSKWPEDGYDRNLDPRSPEARRHIQERFKGMARDLGVDGYWVDFLDTVYNRNDAPHDKTPALFGAGLGEFMKACYDGFAEGCPEPLVEYRIPFANLLSKHHASVFGTTYCENRWDRNRRLAIAHRPFNRGVLSKCDPLAWDAELFENRDVVGTIMSAMILCGPPGLSMDLTSLDEGRRAELERWLEFYNTHRDALTRGELRPFGREYHYPEMMVSHGDTSFAWISRWETDEIPFPQGTRHAFIFTCLPKDESFIARFDITHVKGLVPGRYRALWYNSTVEPSHDGPFELRIRPPTPPSGLEPLKTSRENWDFAPDGTRPSLDIRRGGFLELQWIE